MRISCVSCVLHVLLVSFSLFYHFITFSSSSPPPPPPPPNPLLPSQTAGDPVRSRVTCNINTGSSSVRIYSARRRHLIDFHEDRFNYYLITAHSSKPSGRAVYDMDLRPFACWDYGFETRWGHGCQSHVSVVCRQVEVSATA
jgi:hypothetical protein